MPYKTNSEQIKVAEKELDHVFPEWLFNRLLEENGGDVSILDYPGEWQLLPVFDASSRETLRATSQHIVQRNSISERKENLPNNSIIIAENGMGDLLCLTINQELVWWDHESGVSNPVTVVV